MACQQNSPFLIKSIYRIVSNVQKRFYGTNALEPTGPLLLGKIIRRNKLFDKVDLFHYKDGGFIIYKNRFVISTEYPEYNHERNQMYSMLNTKRYDQLWNERSIYK